MRNLYGFFANRAIRNMSTHLNSGCRTSDRQFNKIFSGWKNDPIEELQRLRNIPVVHERLITLETSSKTREAYLGSRDIKLSHPLQKIAFGRAIETYETLKTTHYAFHHGQAGLNFLSPNILMKTIKELESVNSSFKFHTVLRSEKSLANIEREFNTVEYYKKLIGRYNTTDNHLNGALIAADAYLLSVEPAESALQFFLNSTDRERETVAKSLNEILIYYIVDSKVREQIFNELNLIEINSEVRGLLYGIYVEKEYFNECGYLSGPCGISLELCHQWYPEISESFNSHSLLERLQTESRPLKYYPQIRLLAHKLASDKVKIVVFPTLTNESYFKLLQDVSGLVHKYLRHFSLKERKEESIHPTKSNFSDTSAVSNWSP